MSTLICVSIMVGEVVDALRDAAQARDGGASLVEFRIDDVFHGEGDDDGIAAVVSLVEESPLPCIVTCRPVWEGGEYDGDDAARISLLERLATLDRPPRYIDVELATFSRSANLRQKVLLAVDHEGASRDLSTSLILSAHDFERRPRNLFAIIENMRAEPAARVHKIAFAARSLRDNIELFEILRERDRPTVALGMGEFGLMSRVLAPKFDGFLTFTSLRDDAATAPGQPTLRELHDLYRFESIGRATRVYGVVGWPVGHSVSPHVHNAAFEAVGHDGVYLPAPVPPEWEHFKATVLAMLDARLLDFRGASVTIPHKEHLLRLARQDESRAWEIDPGAARVGAANTMVVHDDGSVLVTNTDIDGVVEPLSRALNSDLRNRRVLVLGSGGAARAAAFGLVERGARVVIANRTVERAASLAADVCRDLQDDSHPCIACDVPPAELPSLDYDAIVNCTPLGMAGTPEAESVAIPERLLDEAPDSLVVMDTVYNPLRTPLVDTATGRGMTVVNGLAMFVHQGAAQSELWTGLAAPEGLMERVAIETLSSRNP